MVEEKIIRMLEKWLENDAFKATYQRLIEVLLDLGETEAAVKVCKVIKAVSSGY
jgi:hypothetical protein